MTDCRVCLGECDREIHAATKRVRQRFREELKLSLRFAKRVPRGKRRVNKKAMYQPVPKYARGSRGTGESLGY